VSLKTAVVTDFPADAVIIYNKAAVPRDRIKETLLIIYYCNPPVEKGSLNFLQFFTLLPAYLYQKEKRDLPEKLQTSKFSDSPPPYNNKCSASHFTPPPPNSLLSLSLSLYVLLFKLLSMIFAVLILLTTGYYHDYGRYLLHCGSCIYIVALISLSNQNFVCPSRSYDLLYWSLYL
jgi:hypothetical protein